MQIRHLTTQWPSVSLRALLCAIALLGTTASIAAPRAIDDGAQLVHPVSKAQVLADSVIEGQTDFGNVTVMQINGAYDRGLTAPRQAVAEQFFATHPDQYDFLVVFSTFEFETGDALAFYNELKNDTIGIGQDLFDYSASFGSAGKLQGYIDMAAMSRYDFAPTSPEYSELLDTLAHETMHRWGEHLHFSDPANANSADLLGQEGSHWSYFLDSDASVMYGNDWQLQGDGKFHSVDIRHRYSALDLYVAGLAAASEVPPFTLIRNGDGGVAADLPKLGAVSGGQGESITIDQVIAASGARVPSAADSQKNFNAAIILLTRPGEALSPDRLLELERFRVRFEQEFVQMTRGRGIMRVFTQTRDTQSAALPEILHGSGTTAAPTGVAGAVAWIESRQAADGHWQDRAATAMRDTVAVVHALDELDPNFSGLALARAWIAAHSVANLDQRAWRLMGADLVADADALSVSQAAQGGFAIAAGWQPSTLDTAIVASALANHDAASPTLNAALQFVGSHQNADGSFGVAAEGRGRILPTLRAATLFAKSGGDAFVQARQNAAAWITTQQTMDGGIGESGQSSMAATIEAYSLLGLVQPAAQVVTGTRSFVRQNQQLDGDWGGSIYLTATAALAYSHDQRANLTITGSLAVNPTQPNVGEHVTLCAVVSNNGNIPVGASVARWYDGDPDQGGLQIGADVAVSALSAGASTPITQTWDTAGHEGSHTIWLKLDADNAIAESSEQDNRGNVNVSVAAAPDIADLAINAADLSLAPASISTLPSQVHLTGILQNIGKQAANGVVVALYAKPDLATPIATATVDVAGLGTAPVAMDFSVTSAATLNLLVRVDPSNAIAEASETNNAAGLILPFGQSLDLAVTSSDLVLTGSTPLVGQDIHFNASLHNLGTVDSPPASLHAEVEQAGVTTTIFDGPVQITAGQIVVQQLTWRTSVPGVAQLRVSVDAANQISETDENNNATALDFSVAALTQADLTFDADSLQFTPNPGLQFQPFSAALVVRNLSSVASDSFRVSLYAADPRTGVAALGSTVVAGLAGSTATTVVVNVADLGVVGDQTMYARIDADDQIVEVDETNNVIIAPVRVVSAPDVAISVADIALTPALPVPGQSVHAQVTVRNLGGQDAHNVVVRMLEGDATNGVAVGADQTLPTLAAGASTVVTWDWTLGVAANAREVTALADPDKIVREGNEDNNAASRPFDVQDGNFFASERYISPNGDGVRDQTAVVFVMPQAGNAQVNIVNGAQYTVRHFSNVALNADLRGQIIWDGRDDRGRIVPDGDYHVSAIDSNQRSQTGPLLTVDNNLTSALEAVDTPYGIDTDIDFSGSSYGTQIPPIASPLRDQLFGRVKGPGDDAIGLYRIDTLFSNPTPVISINWMDAYKDATNLQRDDIDQFAFSPDGASIAAVLDARKAASSDSTLQILVTPVDQTDAPQLLASFTYANLPNIQIFGFFDSRTIVLGPTSDGMLQTIDTLTGTVTPWRALPNDFDQYTDYVVAPSGILLTTQADVDSVYTTSRIFLPRNPALTAVTLYANSDHYGDDDHGNSTSALSPQKSAVAIYQHTDQADRVDLVNLASGNRVTLVQSAPIVETDPNGFVHLVPNYGMRWDEHNDVLLVQDARSRTVTAFAESGGQLSRTQFPALQRVGPYELGNDNSGGDGEGDGDGDAGDAHDLIFVADAPYNVSVDECEGLGSVYDPTRNRYFLRFGEDNVHFYEGERPQKPADLYPYEMGLDRGIEDYYSADFDANDISTLQQDTLIPLLDSADIAQHPLRQRCDDSPPADWPSLIMNDGARIRMDHHVQTLSRGLLPKVWPEGNDSISEVWPDQTRLRIGNRLFTSLLNLTAVVQARTLGRGVEISGVATDRNFAYYQLDWARIEQPNVWHVLTPASSDQVFIDEFLTWVPPQPGTFIIRLTVVDQAGNRTTATASASSFDSSAIDGFALTPRYFSPNGDGVQDQLAVKFNVRLPVTLDIAIADADGNPVRTLSQTYDTANLGAHEFDWDGRNDGGQRVPDGRYRVNVDGFAGWVTLDTLVPRVNGSLDQAYPDVPYCVHSDAGDPPQSVPCKVQLEQAIHYAANDLNLASIKIESSFIGSNNWSALVDCTYSCNVEAMNDPRYWDFYQPAASIFAARRFRLSAVDMAGNSTQFALGDAQEFLPLQEVFQPSPIDELARRRGFYYQPLPLDQTPVVNDDPPIPPIPVEHDANDRLLVWDVSGQLTGVAVEIAISTTPDQWSEVGHFTLAEVSCPQAAGCRGGHDTAELHIPLNVNSLPLGTRAFVRVRGEKNDGTHVYSNQGYLRIGGIDPPRCVVINEPEIVIAADEYFDGPLHAATLTIGGKDIDANMIFNDEIRFLAPRSYLGALAYVKGIDADGFTHFSKQATINCEEPPPSDPVGWIVDLAPTPVVVDQCDGKPSDKIGLRFAIRRPTKLEGKGWPLPSHVRVSYTDGITNLPVVLLDQDVTEQTVASVSKRFIIATANWPEGSYDAHVDKTYPDGGTVVQATQLPIVKQPPQIAISKPADGQHICALPYSKDLQSLPMSGLVNSVGTSSYRLAIGAGATPLAFKCEITEGEDPAQNRQSPPPYDCPNYSLLKNIIGTSVNGPLGTLTDHLKVYNGISTVQLKGLNWSGGTVCTNSTVYLDSAVEFVQRQLPKTMVFAGAKTPVVGIAPLGDPKYAAGQFFLRSNESTQYTATLHHARVNAETGELTLGEEVLATLSHADSVQGDVDLAWDGRINGDIVPDGLYGIDITAGDGCAHSTSIQYGAVVDATPPVVNITAPTNGTSTTAAVVTIMGSATDNSNVASWSVDYALADSPNRWQNLAHGSGPVSPAALLKDWSRGSISGPVDLRLSALDPMGNHAETHVALTLLNPAKMIGDAQLQPILFSPNADTTLDTTRLQLSLLLAANLDLSANGVSLYNGPAPAGITGFVWDGKAANGQAFADGTYSIIINATDPNGVASPETATLTATIDNTPPTLTVLAPTGTFAPATSTVRLHVDDVHLIDYQASLTRNADAAVVASSTGNASGDVTLTALDGFQEGAYTLHLVAHDGAGNVSTRETTFTLDATPPVVALSAPPDAALIAAAKPTSVVGSVSDTNLAQYTLSVAPAATETWTELVQGTANINATQMLAWTPNLPDGDYRLRLRGVDQAGNTTDVIHAVTVDGTPPVAHISAPVSGAAVRASLQVDGTATDAHLADYRIGIIGAAQLAGDQWADIYTGTTPVDNAKLAALTLGLPQDNYVLRLVATDKVGLSSTDQVNIRIDTQPPPVPLGLIGHLSRANHDAVLDWNAVSASDLGGYNVYRGGAKITPSPIPTIHFVDVDAPEGTDAYYVTAVDQSGNESASSNTITLIVDHTPPMVSIAKPAQAERVRGVYSIIGTAYSANDFKQYTLSVQATNPPGALVQLASSTLSAQGQTLAAWNTLTLADETTVHIHLQGEDTSGNIAAADVDVVVDNGPPAAPTGLTAVLDVEDVQTNWNPNSESDLLGYLLYRDNQLVNAISPTLPSDLRSFALTDTQYLDEAVADGNHTYIVYAIDRAGNVSPPSAPADLAPLDNHPPSMVIEQPANNTKFETSITVLATSPDNDLAQVQFAWAPQSSGTWTNLGAALTQPPYRVIWTPPQGTAYGNYRIRALAQDTGGRADPSPPTVTVIYADLTAPDVPSQLAAHADADTVHVTWAASTAPDLAGYRLYRGCCSLINTAALLTTTSYDDLSKPDGNYYYSVVAVDQYGNASANSDYAYAWVFSVDLDQPYSPSSAATFELSGSSARSGSIGLHIDTDQGGTDSTPGATTNNGNFALAGQPLALGSNHFTVRVTDANGNISRPADFWVDRGNVPAAPTGVAANVADHSVTLSWNANSEADLLGYRVLRNGSPVLADTALGEATVASTLGGTNPANAIDGDAQTFWSASVYSGNAPSDPSLELAWTQPRIVTSANLTWSSDITATGNLDFFAWSGHGWIHVANVRQTETTSESIFFDKPYRTTRVKLVAHNSGSYSYHQALQLAEMQLFERPLQTATTFAETVIDGTYQYQVSAVSAYAFESPLSTAAQADVGDTQGPDAVVLAGSLTGNNATLTWTPSAAPDVARYALQRDGSVIATVNVGSPLSVIDDGLKLGTYSYVVYAYDAFNNVGPASNTVTLTLSDTGPGMPVIDEVSASEEGEELDVTWHPGIGADPVDYILLRATDIAGPYAEIDHAADTNYYDVDVSNGTLYCYEVKAVDDAGDISDASAPKCGTPHDSVHPDAPILTYPTTAATPVTIDADSSLVCGDAQPGSEVELNINGVIGSQHRIAREDDRSDEYQFMRDDSSVPGLIAPDGQHIAIINDDGSIQVYANNNSVESVTLPAKSAVSVRQAQWAAHGTALYFLDGNADDLYRWVPGKAAQPITQPITDVVNLAVSADESTFALVGNYSNAGGPPVNAVWIVKRAGGSPQQVTGLDPATVQALRWSPNATYLLGSTSDASIALIDANSTTVVTRVVADANVVPSWNPNGSKFGFARGNAQNGDDLFIYDTYAQSESLRFGQSTPMIALAWSAAGGGVAILDPENLRFVSVDGNPDEQPLARPVKPNEQLPGWYNNNNGWYNLTWTASGSIFANDDWNVFEIDPPGQFCFDDVPLNVGKNLISAAATDSSGNRSLDSATIEIDTPADNLPDLAVAAADILFLPPSGNVGQNFSTLVTLHNYGAQDVAQPTLGVTLTAPDGSQRGLTPLVALTALSAGASESVTFEIGVLSTPGTYRLDVLADPAQQLREGNEDNNAATAALAVSGDGQPALELNLTRNLFAPGDKVEGELAVTNPGGTFNGHVHTDVVDATGALVANLGDLAINELAFGQRFMSPVSWDAAGVLAGNYQMQAQLFAGDGSLISSKTDPFSIAAVQHVQLLLVPDSNTATVGDSVGLHSHVAFTDGNAPISGATLHLEARDVNGAPVWSVDHALGSLDSGASLIQDDVWPTSGQVPATYALHLTLTWPNGTQSTDSSVTLVASTPSVVVGGSLEFAPGTTVIAGQNTTLLAHVSNTSATDLIGVQARVRIVTGQNQTPVAQADEQFDLASAATHDGSMNLSAPPLALQTYLAILEVHLPGDSADQWRLLAQQGFALVDQTPPDIVVIDPVDSVIQPAVVPFHATILDRDSAVADAAVQVDGGNWQPVSVDVSGRYARGLTGLSDGAHTFSVRAHDTWGNQAQVGPQAFTVDATPPAIVITGVADGDIVNHSVMPHVVITDANLSGSDIRLNGAPFASDTVVASDAQYVLTARATDAAGNQSIASVQFTIDATPPQVVFVAPANNAVVTTDTVDVVGTTQALAKVHLASGGFVADVDADAAGSFTVLAVPLQLGLNDVSAHATDQAANQGPGAILTLNYVLPVPPCPKPPNYFIFVNGFEVHGDRIFCNGFEDMVSLTSAHDASGLMTETARVYVQVWKLVMDGTPVTRVWSHALPFALMNAFASVSKQQALHVAQIVRRSPNRSPPNSLERLRAQTGDRLRLVAVNRNSATYNNLVPKNGLASPRISYGLH